MKLKHKVYLLGLLLLVGFNSIGQAVSYYQAQFNGGVTGCGYAPDYGQAGTGTFTLSIAPGSTIRQAYLFVGSQGPASPITVTFNGTPLTYNSAVQVSPTFQSSIYGGNSGVFAQDVTSLISAANNTYTIDVPAQLTGPTDIFTDYYLYVAYSNNALPQVSTAIFLNAADMANSVNYALNFTYPIGNTNNVGFAIYGGYICDDVGDGEAINVNGTALGTVGGPNSNSGTCAGPYGDFGYQNSTLTALLDCNADQAMTGSDGVSNIQALVTNCTSNVNLNFTGGNSSNVIWAVFFAYSGGQSSSRMDTTVCSGVPVQLNAGSGSVWAPTTGLSCTSCSSPVATVTTNTTYIATSNGACGSASDTFAITINTSAPVTVQNNDTTICAGNAVQLTATSTATINWLPVTGLSCTQCNNPVATPGTTTTYVATTGGGGCAISDSMTVTVLTAPTLTAGDDTTICAGQSAQLSAVSSGTVTWSPAAGLSCTACNNSTATPASLANYVATATNGTCAVTDTVVITVVAIPTVTATNDTNICAGSSVQLNAISTGTITWSPATGLSCTSCNNPIATPATTTNYVATASTGNCTSSTTVVVTVVQVPTITISNNDTTICSGNAVQLNAVSSGTATWTPVSGLSCTSCNNPMARPTATTTYVATVGSPGCQAVDSVTITVNQFATLTLSNDTTICQGLSAQLNAVSNSTVAWSPTAGLSCNNCNTPVANPTVTTTYYCTAGVGCPVTDSVKVTVLNYPSLSLNNDTNICPGQQVDLIATSSGTASWAPSIGLSCSVCNNPVATDFITTTYVATIANGNCATVHSVTITMPNQSTLTLSNDTTICQGLSAQLNAASNSTVTWTPGVSLSCNNCNTPVANPTVTTTYYCTAGLACPITDSVKVTVLNYPALSLSNDTTVCPGQRVALLATSSGTAGWTPATGLSCTVCNNPFASDFTTTTYVATVANGNCITVDSVTISLLSPVMLTLSSDTAICRGDTAVLTATSNGLVVWGNATSISCDTCNTPLAYPTQSTVYTATADNNGCTISRSVNVTVNSSNVQVDSSVTIFTNESAQLHAMGVDSVFWVPASTLSSATSFDPIAKPGVSSTLYYVYGYKNGCKSVDSVWVYVVEPCTQLLLPTAFSPNGDGVNDVFRIKNHNYDKLNWFRVYDRWGVMVYESTDMTVGWDGTFKEMKQPIGVYIYSISVLCHGESYEFKGNVTLLR